MSSERIPFKLPLVVTVGPNTEDHNALERFAEKLSQQDVGALHDLVRDIVAGQSRIITAGMSADELFHERDSFKRKVSDGVEETLRELGLKVFNANLEELTDEPGSLYFQEQRKRALSGVHADARVFVAHAETKGEIGSKQQETERRKQAAALEAEAQLTENTRQLAIAQSLAELRIAKAELERRGAVADAEAQAAIQQRTLVLSAAIERDRAFEEAERLRAGELTAKVVDAEKLVRETTGITEARRLEAENAAAIRRLEADALFYSQQQQARGMIELGSSEAEARRAMLIAEADGISAKLHAEAAGLERLVQAAGGPEQFLVQTVIKQRTLPEIAEAQAAAVRDMKPVIWHSSGGVGAQEGVLASLAKDLPPLFGMVKQTTGLDLMEMLKRQVNTTQKIE
jgi:flotillin